MVLNAHRGSLSRALSREWLDCHCLFFTVILCHPFKGGGGQCKPGMFWGLGSKKRSSCDSHASAARTRTEANKKHTCVCAALLLSNFSVSLPCPSLFVVVDVYDYRAQCRRRIHAGFLRRCCSRCAKQHLELKQTKDLTEHLDTFCSCLRVRVLRCGVREVLGYSFTLFSFG